jgi:hypothetical protein
LELLGENYDEEPTWVFGHDLYRLVAYYMELQKEHPEKLVPVPDSEAAHSARRLT